MMKELVLLSSLVLLLSTVVIPRVNSQELKDLANVEQEQEQRENYFSPSALVDAAHKGRLKDWNIPSYGLLQSGYDSGRITAEDLIDAAIKAGKLLPQTVDNEQYINNVESELEQLHED